MSRSKLLLLTLGISSAIHLVLAAGYLWLNQSASAPSAQSVVEISLQQATPANTTTPSQPPEDIPDEKLLSSQRAADRQHLLSEAIKAKPRPADITRPQAEVEEAINTAKQTPAENTLTQSPEAEADPGKQPTAASLQAVRAGQQNAAHNSALEAEKQNYLGLVAEHINSYKYYPRSAIRRGTEGLVEVSFDLQPDGSIENLRTHGEHRVLLSASQRSVEQALPMPQRSESLLALGAIHIEFSMKYFLHEQ